MLDVYLVTVFIEKLNFPIGYFPLDEALRIKNEMLDTYQSMGFRTNVLITQYDKLPMEEPAIIRERAAGLSAAN